MINEFKKMLKCNNQWSIPNGQSDKGQALVTLLFFVVMGIAIISAAAVILIVNIQAASRVEQGTQAYYVAESGAEEAVLRLLRNPSFAGTFSFLLSGGSASVTITQGNPVTVISVGQMGNFIRKIQLKTVYNNGNVTISSWKEIF